MRPTVQIAVLPAVTPDRATDFFGLLASVSVSLMWVSPQKMPGLPAASAPAGKATFSPANSLASKRGRSCTTSRNRLLSRRLMMPSVSVSNLRM